MRWRMAPASVQQRVLIEADSSPLRRKVGGKPIAHNPQLKCDGQRVEGLVIENPFIG